MKDKNYYIPKIEELHPGMEIELFYQKGKYDYANAVSIEAGGDGLPLFTPNEKTKSWHKHTIPSSDNDDIYWQYPLARFKEIIDEGIIRIKHLDVNDFKSLKWNVISDHLRVNISGYKDSRLQKITGIYIFASKWLLLTANRNKKHSVLIAGRVQNISELKVIIKQLKIKCSR